MKSSPLIKLVPAGNETTPTEVGVTGIVVVNFTIVFTPLALRADQSV